MAKKFSDTEKLAINFVNRFLGREFSYNTDRRYLAGAKKYLNPKPDPVTDREQRKFTYDEVWGCLQWMKRIGVKVNSIHQITWTHKKTGKLYIEEYCEPPDPPPIYMKLEREQWEKRYGRTLQN